MVTRARKARIFLLGRGSARHALRRTVTAVCGYGKEKSRSRMAAGSRNGADDGSRTRFAICISAEKQRENASVRKSVRKSAIIFPMTCALYPSPPRCRGGLFLSPRTALLRRGAPCRGTLRQAAVLLLEFLEAVDVNKVFHAVHVLSIYTYLLVCHIQEGFYLPSFIAVSIPSLKMSVGPMRSLSFSTARISSASSSFRKLT